MSFILGTHLCLLPSKQTQTLRHCDFVQVTISTAVLTCLKSPKSKKSPEFLFSKLQLHCDAVMLTYIQHCWTNMPKVSKLTR